jgi:phospholipid/cholesterol/gamma-HCH transport system substrate-binding protein
MRRIATILVLVLVVGAVTAVITTSSPGKAPTYEIRAIFDDAAFAVPGEDVRVAGAPVGTIQSLDVCTTAPCPQGSPHNKAAVTITVDNAHFTPFYANAHCSIRPQSLIGEKYVDCEPGSSSSPPLQKISGGPGKGSYLLPVANTTSPVDSDIVQNIYQQPIRQRFALILDELGTGLAARGSDLNAVIHRANPALGQTDKVLKILAHQNKVLARLATDSDAVLAPLARAKRQLADFVVQANTTSVASASRAADISRSIQLFPTFLRRLRPLVTDLGTLADQGTPLMNTLRQSAGDLSRQFENLAPFANAARPALIELGNSAQESQAPLVATLPLAKRLDRLATQTEPAAKSLDKLTSSLDQTGAIEYLMSLLFYGASTTNMFDRDGHLARTEPQVGSCASYVKRPVPGCSANFGQSFAAAAAPPRSSSEAVSAQTSRAGAQRSSRTGPKTSTAKEQSEKSRARARAAADASAARVVRDAVAGVDREQSRDGSDKTLQGLLGYLVGSGR